jgi:5,10-methylenetetrahydromethanopterin reductase
MRVAGLDIHRLLAGEAVPLGASTTRLRTKPRPVPVYPPAAGPRMVKVTGEVADGALVLAGLRPDPGPVST